MVADLLRLAPLLLMLLMAAAIDARDRRIPNWLNLLLLIGGFAQSLCGRDGLGAWTSLIGLFVGALIPFVLFAIGALGAGDVKLMAAIGVWLGPWPALAVFAIAAVVGMLIVLAQALAQGRLQLLVRNSVVVALNLVHVRELGLEHASQTGKQSRSVDRPLPYAVPVTAAVLLLLARKWALA